MKIDISLQTPTRFQPDDNTVLHFHTGHVSPRKPLVVKSGEGPSLYLRKAPDAAHYPESDASTPYGFGRSVMTAFSLRLDDFENYISSASSDSPSLEDRINQITDRFRLSLFFKPEMDADDEYFDDYPTETKGVLIAGVPGRFGLYQFEEKLRLKLVSSTQTYWNEMPGGVDQNAWHLVEVMWDRAENSGRPVWYINGKQMIGTPGMDNPYTGQLDGTAGDRFNLAMDPLSPDNTDRLLYWQGKIREVEISNQALFFDDDATLAKLDAEMNGRAMTLFGLCTDTSPVPDFRRGSCAWIMANGSLHKLSYNHPRNTELGVLVEEERTNLVEISTPETTGGTGDGDPPDPDGGWTWDGVTDDWYVHYWHYSALPAGRYTIWFDQENKDGTDPITLDILLGDNATLSAAEKITEIGEDDTYILNLEEEKHLFLEVLSVTADTKLNHVQVEQGMDDGPAAVGKTSHIVSLGSEAELPITRDLETLYYEVSGADLVDEQGRLDIQITPQHTGPRAMVDDVAVAGDVFSMSLVRDEILSTDGSGDQSSFGTKGLWTEGDTRKFHVEWQPGTRLLMEDTLGLVAAADYCGTWRTPELLELEADNTKLKLYIGGGPNGGEDPESGSDTGVRANSFVKQLVVDDWVPRYHADLHRFMYRQFGEGGFSQDEASYFRKWRRTEGDALALMARLGDRLKLEAYADTTDSLLREWEQALGLPGLWALSDDERREVVANMFKTLGAHDAEIEEAITYLTDSMNDFAVVIERHLGDVSRDETKAWDVWEMYEYYVQIPEMFYNDTYLELIRWLMERQEPAHTVGWPIVRTEFHTTSDRFADVVQGQGTEDAQVFDDIGARTERDCVGLSSWDGRFPKGIWLPTNLYSTLTRDLWEDSLPHIPKPSVLISCHEQSGSLSDRISGDADEKIKFEPTPNADELRYEVPCAGLLVADRDKDLESSAVKMNLGRGVEIQDGSHCFLCQESGTDPKRSETQQLHLGADKSAAFLHLFRVTKAPTAGTTLLYKAEVIDGDGVGHFYSVGINSNLRIQTHFYGVEPDLTTVYDQTRSHYTGYDYKEGEWLCMLTVVDRAKGEVRVYENDYLLDTLDRSISGWVMDSGKMSLSIGDDGGSSALVHHAYWAAWLGHEATGFDETLVQKFCQAVDGPPFVSSLLGFDPIAWPVGDVSEPSLDAEGELACKYIYDQFPFADLGDRYDANGEIQRIRGVGTNRAIENLLEYSESFGGDWDPTPTSTVVGPEGLTNAGEVTGMDHNDTFTSGTFTVDVSKYVGVSCWARLSTGSDPADFELFCSDDPVVYPASSVFTLTDRWQRIEAVFDPDATPVAVGLKNVSNTDGLNLQVWGFQAVNEPVIGPYVPNLSTGTTEAQPSKVLLGHDYLMWPEKQPFTGFNRRGFVNFRIKFEELVDKLAEDKRLILLDAFERHTDDLEAFDKAALELRDYDDDYKQHLVFNLQFRMANNEWWEDDVEWCVNVDPTSGDPEDLDVKAAWTNPDIEHQIAVAWDITRPVAGTDRHIALWVDGQLAVRRNVDDSLDNYADHAPEDAIDQEFELGSLSLGNTRFYCHEQPPPSGHIDENLIQPCAVFREIEIYTRHHPGLFTPTRLEVREKAEEE